MAKKEGCKLAFRIGNRKQINLLPVSIEEYVGASDPVRAYDAFVDRLDFSELGIEIDEKKVGNSNFDPVSMMKLLVYGYSYGWRSSRKLERAVQHNMSFIWLMGGLRPDHKTIANFRKNNFDALEKVLKQCARMCIELDLIDGNMFFVDGTKIRANASRCKNYTHEKYEKKLKEVDERIEQLLLGCEEIDALEEEKESLVKMKEELHDQEKLKSAIEIAMAKFKDIGLKTKNGKERTVNKTDPQCALMSSVQGSHASYNVQSVVDEKNSLIVSMDANDITSDISQFASQINNAEEVTGKECKIAVADAGYADIDELASIDSRGTTVIVPSKRQALHGEEKGFSKSDFSYNKEQDCYYCPCGEKLTYNKKAGDSKRLYYFITDAKICAACKHFGKCTQSKDGRRIVRLANEEIKEKLEELYLKPESQEIYKKRQAKVEHPFGHIERNLGITNFLVRGQQGAKAEISFGATCFNIARMITIFGGVQGFLKAIAN